MSTISTPAATADAAATDESSFDAAVRVAAQRQIVRMREFGLHVEEPEQDAYRRLIARLSA